MITFSMEDFGRYSQPCWGINPLTRAYDWSTFNTELVTRIGWRPEMSLCGVIRGLLLRRVNCGDVWWFLNAFCSWHPQDPRLVALHNHLVADFIYPQGQKWGLDSLNYVDTASFVWLQIAEACNLHTFHVDRYGTY